MNASLSKSMTILKHKAKRPKWWFRGVFRFITYLLMLDLAFIFLYPFLYMLITSIKSYDDLLNVSVKWIPSTIYLENFKFAFDNLKYPVTFTNSLIVTSLATVGHLLGCSYIAYGFARFKFPFRKLAFFVLILTIVVPVQTIITPIYLIFSQLGFVGSDFYLAILLPTLFGFGLKGGLFIFIFYSYFQGLPKSFEEAAYIDGCGSIRTFFKIIVPTATSAFLICGVLSFVWHWNDYYEASLYITKSSRFLLPQMLPTLYSMMEQLENATTVEMIQLKYRYNDAVLMAGTALAVLPVLFGYIFVQNKFMEGVETTGMKD